MNKTHFEHAAYTLAHLPVSATSSDSLKLLWALQSPQQLLLWRICLSFFGSENVAIYRKLPLNLAPLNTFK